MDPKVLYRQYTYKLQVLRETKEMPAVQTWYNWDWEVVEECETRFWKSQYDVMVRQLMTDHEHRHFILVTRSDGSGVLTPAYWYGKGFPVFNQFARLSTTQFMDSEWHKRTLRGWHGGFVEAHRAVARLEKKLGRALTWKEGEAIRCNLPTYTNFLDTPFYQRHTCPDCGKIVPECNAGHPDVGDRYHSICEACYRDQRND